jgi:hypothetical protein
MFCASAISSSSSSPMKSLIQPGTSLERVGREWEDVSHRVAGQHRRVIEGGGGVLASTDGQLRTFDCALECISGIHVSLHSDLNQLAIQIVEQSDLPERTLKLLSGVVDLARRKVLECGLEVPNRRTSSNVFKARPLLVVPTVE